MSWQRMNHRMADLLYPWMNPVWAYLPIRLKVWFFLNCDMGES